VKTGRDGRIISKGILKKHVVRMWARFMYVRTWWMGIECLCFVIGGEFCHPLYISFLRGTLLLALNNPLLTRHYSCVFELNFVSLGWQSVTWEDWRVCLDHPSSVGLGPLSKDWEQFMLLGKRVTSLQGKKVGKVYFIGVNCLEQYILTLLEMIDDSICFTSIIIFRKKRHFNGMHIILIN
jgi:hypothetical protein